MVNSIKFKKKKSNEKPMKTVPEDIKSQRQHFQRIE